MVTTVKNVHEFTSLDDWANYATINMGKAEAQRHTENGTEIWLVAERGILGKWGEEISRGYIEEYRTEERLAEERKKLNQKLGLNL